MRQHRGLGVLGRLARPLVLATLCAAFLVFPGVGQAQKPQAADPTTYEVKKGDSLFKIARDLLPPKASIWQMALALYRANPDAFVGGNINQLPVGRILKIPSPEAVTAVEAAQAGREVQALIHRPQAPVPPATLPAPGIEPKPRVPPQAAPKAATPPTLSSAQAEASYQRGLAEERRGDLAAALKSYLEAGESGNGKAQKKLGDFYNAGNAVVKRDYETALKWYQKAREQGVEIPKPLTPGFRH